MCRRRNALASIWRTLSRVKRGVCASPTASSVLGSLPPRPRGFPALNDFGRSRAFKRIRDNSSERCSGSGPKFASNLFERSILLRACSLAYSFSRRFAVSWHHPTMDVPRLKPNDLANSTIHWRFSIYVLNLHEIMEGQFHEVADIDELFSRKDALAANRGAAIRQARG